MCVQTGTTNELIVADFARANRITLNPLVMQNLEEIFQSLFSGRCDAFTSDASQLYGERTKLGAPDDHVVLPEIISKEPLGPAVRKARPRRLALCPQRLFPMCFRLLLHLFPLLTSSTHPVLVDLS